jgi:hypothetical protein
MSRLEIGRSSAQRDRWGDGGRRYTRALVTALLADSAALSITAAPLMAILAMVLAPLPAALGLCYSIDSSEAEGAES